MSVIRWPAPRLSASIWGAAHAFVRMLSFLVAPVSNSFSPASPLLSPRVIFPGNSASCMKTVGPHLSSQCGSRESSQGRTLRFSCPNKFLIPLVSLGGSQMSSISAGAEPLTRVCALPFVSGAGAIAVREQHLLSVCGVFSVTTPFTP